MLTPRYVMVGGFLGAGKTTAILRLAGRLQARGERVGLITNDQSYGLVDTAMLGAHGFATEEVTGGCFCCKFQSLVEAAEKLRGQVSPTLFLAEPVGSCTDLQATVTYPLAQLYGSDYTLAPFSVLVDPIRAQRMVGLRSGKTFSAKVRYIYEKQLEEADLIVINKTDLLSTAESHELGAALRDRWPQAVVMFTSARHGDGIDEWLEAILSTRPSRRTPMQVDYDLYAQGEAELGWLNLQATISGQETDGNQWLWGLADAFRHALASQDAEIAHLKMTLTPDVGKDMAIVNLVRDGSEPEMSHRLVEPLHQGDLLVNLRAAGSPESLRATVLDVLQQVARTTPLEPTVTSVEAFRPGRPVPTHRLLPSSS